LLRRLRSEVGQAGVNAERNRIADVFLQNGHWELALPFLLEAENYERAAEIIADRGDEWISAGAIKSLGDFADKVPISFLEKYPRSLLHKAEIARLQGETDRSTSLLNRAVKLFREQDDAVSEAEAFHSLASLARRRSRPDEALELLGKAEKLVALDSETYLKCLNTRGLCFIAKGSWNDAEQQFRATLELAEAQSNERYVRLVAHNLALAPGLRGDFGEALRWLNRIFRDDAPEKKFPQEAIGHLNVARLHLYRGEFEKTELHLEKALELAQLFNLKALIPEIFESYANFYREKGDFPHAAEYYERSITAYSEAGVDIATRELNEERAKFCISQGDLTKARALLENLIEARFKLNLDIAVNTARLCLYRVDLLEGRTEELPKKVTELLAFFHEQNHYYDEATASMLLAETYHRLGKQKEMVAPLLRVLDLSARFDYEYWLKNEIRRNKEMFGHDDIAEKLPPDLQEELGRGIAATPVSPVYIVDTLPRLTDLTIKVLGHVDIYRDPSKPFAPDAWTTRRSRDIFCYIATRKNRRVAKDILIEEFWGDEDLATIEKNFHPTISHIRKALNSRQALKQNFIVFRDGSYQLNPEYTYSIDSEDFLGFIAAAEQAKRDQDAESLRKNLESALVLHRGDFMEGSYEDWAEEQRHFYKEQLTRVLNGLAKLSVTEKRWNDALRYANETLVLDPYREDLHRLVMKVLAAQSKSSAVRKHYDSMRDLLRDELGVDPSPETRRLFKELAG
jgi:LuxR family transcriptional regulator, maltose regulon positive regulatory protein